MEAYVVEVTPRAKLDLHALSRDLAWRVSEKMRMLTLDPHPRGDTIKRLHGISSPLSRLRIGDYRAIFRIDEDRRRVDVLRVVHRSRLDRTLIELT